MLERATPAGCFNLLDRPWIPCIASGDRVPVELSLRDTLLQSPELSEIADPSPLVILALHRLLLAILHRVYTGPRDGRTWHALWQHGAWDTDALNEYFARWQARFDLFDDQHPFYQVASLDMARYGSPVAKLVHELAAGNNATLFDHTTDDDGTAFTAAQAARGLVACQAFAVGGLVSYDQKAHKSADAAPLAKGAVALVRGETLFHTLLLNMHQYHHANRIPFGSRRDDEPAWERDKLTEAADRHPDGYLDLLTWQSRRILLQPEMDETGALVVRRVVIMKGYQFPTVDERYGKETMLAFRHNPEASKGQDPWPAVGFREDRALWRDSLAFIQSIGGQRERPKVLTWLDEVAGDGLLDRARIVPLDLYGLATDKAKVLFWRHERMQLPLAYLHERDLLAELQRALSLAEEIADALRESVCVLAKLLLAPESDRRDGRKPDGGDIKDVVRQLGAERRYWAQLAAPFSRLLIELPSDLEQDEEGEWVYGSVEVSRWFQMVCASAEGALIATTRGLDESARSLKASARAHGKLEQQLRAIVRRRGEAGGRG